MYASMRGPVRGACAATYLSATHHSTAFVTFLQCSTARLLCDTAQQELCSASYALIKNLDLHFNAKVSLIVKTFMDKKMLVQYGVASCSVNHPCSSNGKFRCRCCDTKVSLSAKQTQAKTHCMLRPVRISHEGCVLSFSTRC